MITIMRMLNGEEIIADVKVNEDNTATFINKPYILNQMINKEGKVDVELIPTALFCKDRTAILNEGSVMYTAEATDEIAEVYSQQFSNIIKPSSQILHG